MKTVYTEDGRMFSCKQIFEYKKNVLRAIENVLNTGEYFYTYEYTNLTRIY